MGLPVRLVKGIKWECTIHCLANHNHALCHMMAHTVAACASTSGSNGGSAKAQPVCDIVFSLDSELVFAQGNEFTETPVSELWANDGLPDCLRRMQRIAPAVEWDPFWDRIVLMQKRLRQ